MKVSLNRLFALAMLGFLSGCVALTSSPAPRSSTSSPTDQELCEVHKCALIEERVDIEVLKSAGEDLTSVLDIDDYEKTQGRRFPHTRELKMKVVDGKRIYFVHYCPLCEKKSHDPVRKVRRIRR